MLAQDLASIDVLSGGRLDVAIGAGWNRPEYDAIGLPFDATPVRQARLAEAVTVLKGAFSGEAFSFSGEHYTVTDYTGGVVPVQRPHPPVIIGGGGAKRTPRLAATYADEFNMPFASVEGTATQFGRVREAAAQTGRSVLLSAAQVLCVGKDDAEIARRAAVIGREVEELKANGLAGSPAEVVEKIGRYAEVGAQRVYLQILDLDDLDHLEPGHERADRRGGAGAVLLVERREQRHGPVVQHAGGVRGGAQDLDVDLLGGRPAGLRHAVGHQLADYLTLRRGVVIERWLARPGYRRRATRLLAEWRDEPRPIAPPKPPAIRAGRRG